VCYCVVLKDVGAVLSFCIMYAPLSLVSSRSIGHTLCFNGILEIYFSFRLLFKTSLLGGPFDLQLRGLRIDSHKFL
jgi:hypothetical protein